ncbi:MAG: VWA domain-containing protein, partial [Planctomycetes bacterium]|nr:VWA domain-containing protein [Planctomycetota bacterium]
MLTRSLAILTILLVSTRVCSQEQVDPGPRAIRPPKDFRLFLDCSGSMAGGKAKALKESAKLAVACLDDKCLLTIVAFNSSAKVSPVFSMRKADDRTAAKNWIDQIQTGGGTDYLAALKATALPKGVTSIWISDGAHNGRPEPVEQFVNKHVRSTIYTVAVECAPSSPAENLMTRMAVLSGGSFVRVEKSEELVKTILDIATRIGGKYRSHPPTKDVLSFQGVDGRLIAVGYDGTPTVLSSPNVTKLQRQHFADLPGQKVDLVVTELSQNCNVSIRLDGKRSKDAHLGEIHLSGLPSGEMHVDTKDGRVFAG